MRRLALALLLSSSLLAQDPWTREDTVRETAVVALNAADWLQTLQIEGRYRDGSYEQNPILGRHPSRAAINEHFAINIALNVLVAYLLPERWRAPFQYVSIGWEAGIVAHNYRLGFRVQF